MRHLMAVGQASQMQASRVQAGTSHNLADNFARAFGTTYLDAGGKERHVHQSSWGMSTRMVGGIVMAHGDDAGLRFPPHVAPVQARSTCRANCADMPAHCTHMLHKTRTRNVPLGEQRACASGGPFAGIWTCRKLRQALAVQVVIVPVMPKEKARESVIAQADAMRDALAGAGVRVRVDASDMSPGWKFNFWEMKGVPVRLEVGPRDVEKRACVLARRDRPGKAGKEFGVSVDAGALVAAVRGALEGVQARPLRLAARACL
jgi:prolyl-tRNA synthetase